MKKIGREREVLTQDTFWPQNLFDGRKCSLRWEVLTQGLDAGTGCWHQIDVLHSFGHWSTEADLSPCARLVWGVALVLDTLQGPFLLKDGSLPLLFSTAQISAGSKAFWTRPRGWALTSLYKRWTRTLATCSPASSPQ